MTHEHISCCSVGLSPSKRARLHVARRKSVRYEIVEKPIESQRVAKRTYYISSRGPVSFERVMCGGQWSAVK
jgi:hypothetical protein